jgi:hypothetical protein
LEKKWAQAKVRGVDKAVAAAAADEEEVFPEVV